MTSRNGMNSLKMSNAAIRKGCKIRESNISKVAKLCKYSGFNKNSTVTYAEYSNESID